MSIDNRVSIIYGVSKGWVRTKGESSMVVSGLDV